MHPQAQATGGGEVPVGGDGAAEVPALAQAARVVDGHHPERDELPDQGFERVHDIRRRGRRHERRDEADGGLVQDARRPTVRSAPDHATVGIGTVGVDAGGIQGCGAHEERVVVVGPQGDQPARGRDLQVVCGRPAANQVRVPSGPLDPCASVGSRGRRGTDTLDDIVDRPCIVEVRPAPRQGGLCEVEVCVGESRDRDLVRSETEAPCSRSQRRLDLGKPACRDDTATLDGDRLDPAWPTRSRERGDPARDEGAGAAHRYSSSAGSPRPAVADSGSASGTASGTRGTSAARSGALTRCLGCTRGAPACRRFGSVARVAPFAGLHLGCGRHRDGVEAGGRRRARWPSPWPPWA